MRMFTALAGTARVLGLAALLASAPLALSRAAEGAFPDRPPRIIGGFAPGGTSDIVARLVAEAVAPAFGQRPVVENRTGANGAIAAEAVARAAPDGHTVLQCATGLLTITPQLPGAQMPLDPAQELVPIVNVAHSTQVMVVAAQSPYQDVAGFLAAARRQPGRLSYASAGIGSVSHLSGARLAQQAGLGLVHVPYRGAALGVVDVVAGRADTIITNLGDVVAQIQGGGLRLLAFADGIGSPLFPEAPQISATVPGYAVSGWFGLCGPRGMPAGLVARWAAAVRQGMDTPEMRRRLQELGLTPRLEEPARFAETIAQDHRDWGAVIRAGGIRVE
ncbi:Bug family tripartite tricarboxylate transporter substrate binding protein [Teichococcus aestuarii]|uniref:Bug family tripartite tricarboxylate transporter substrate binding protein n=1 Tax=Teichococcus aestuarii TaxID=568898 RepID=UPI003621E03E